MSTCGACRVLKVSRSGFYEWARAASARDVADAYLLDTIIDIHTAARGTYGCGECMPNCVSANA